MGEDRIQIRNGKITLDIEFDYNWKDGKKEMVWIQKGKFAVVVKA